MIETRANIRITRQGGMLTSVEVIMPFWNKLQADKSILVDIPLFGIKTFACNENDAEKAVEEAVTAFCIASDKFGNGVEAELASLGWQFDEVDNEDSLLNYNAPDAVLAQIMDTGENYSNKLVLKDDWGLALPYC